jgi:hypothetical protein
MRSVITTIFVVTFTLTEGLKNDPYLDRLKNSTFFLPII